jgi:hypothetical protein
MHGDTVFIGCFITSFIFKFLLDHTSFREEEMVAGTMTTVEAEAGTIIIMEETKITTEEIITTMVEAETITTMVVEETMTTMTTTTTTEEAAITMVEGAGATTMVVVEEETIITTEEATTIM